MIKAGRQCGILTGLIYRIRITIVLKLITIQKVSLPSPNYQHLKAYKQKLQIVPNNVLHLTEYHFYDSNEEEIKI